MPNQTVLWQTALSERAPDNFQSLCTLENVANTFGLIADFALVTAPWGQFWGWAVVHTLLLRGEISYVSPQESVAEHSGRVSQTKRKSIWRRKLSMCVNEWAIISITCCFWELLIQWKVRGWNLSVGAQWMTGPGHGCSVGSWSVN